MDFKTPSSRAVWTSLLLVLAIGYVFAATQIYLTAGVTPASIVKHYQGDDEEMIAPMTAERLTMLSHAHMLTMPWILLPAAWIFSRSRRLGEGVKTIIIVTSFAGIVVDIGSWWGVRYLGKPMLVPLFAGGAMMGAGFIAMTGYSLIHIWRENHET